MSINGRVYEDGLNKKYIYIGGRRIVVQIGTKIEDNWKRNYKDRRGNSQKKEK